MSDRKDTADKKRIELHLHTKMSAMDSVLSAEDAVRTAKEWGHSAVAITDHNSVRSFPEAMKAAEKYGIKVIYGVEICHKEAKEEFEGYHQTILVKDQTGLKNLYRLISKGSMEYSQKGRPAYPKKVLDAYRDGLLFGSACGQGELFEAIWNNATDSELSVIVNRYDYLEIQPVICNRYYIELGLLRCEDEIRTINRRIVALGEKYRKPVVATGNVHFKEPEDEICRKILMQDKYYEDEADRGLYFRTTEEMLEEFSYLGKEKAYEVVVKNPNKLNDMIEDVLPLPKGSYDPYLENAEEDLKAICEKRVRELYGVVPPEFVQKRFDDELSIILRNGYATFYMIAKKLVDKSESLGYHACPRGCVGASFVAYLLGISDIDPLKYGIPYETFLGYSGDRVPDIDLNFAPEIKKELFGSAKEILGMSNVIMAGTVVVLSEKNARGLADKYFEKHNVTLSEEEKRNIIDKCVGVFIGAGLHPAGMMAVPEEYDVHDFTPLECGAAWGGVIMTHLNYNDLIGTLTKIDILVHDVPTYFKLLEDLTGIKISDVPLDDPKVLELFTEGDTDGIPEFEAQAVKDILKLTRPQCFDDLLKISGVMHGTTTWYGNGEELIKNGVCSLGDLIALRDDIMLYLTERGMDRKTAFFIMECIRKGKGLSSEQEAHMREVAVPEWYIESCKKIKYLFPKAHAVANVMNALRLAWFKLYYPHEFHRVLCDVNP